MNNNLSGHLAEATARWFMRFKGYKIVACNFVTGRGTTCGEVDFVARRGHTLVFVEVKKRSSLERAAYAIAPAQQKRIRNGALVFLKNNPQYKNFDLRFDAILVIFPFTIKHIKNAW